MIHSILSTLVANGRCRCANILLQWKIFPDHISAVSPMSINHRKMICILSHHFEFVHCAENIFSPYALEVDSKLHTKIVELQSVCMQPHEKTTNVICTLFFFHLHNIPLTKSVRFRMISFEFRTQIHWFFFSKQNSTYAMHRCVTKTQSYILCWIILTIYFIDRILAQTNTRRIRIIFFAYWDSWANGEFYVHMCMSTNWIEFKRT